MKKAKMAIWLLILGFFGLIVYQNLELFLEEQSIGLNLMFVDAYRADAVPNAIFFLAFFLIGLLIAYFSSLAERFRSKKMIKVLNTKIDAHIQDIALLKNELDALKGGTSNTGEAAEGSSEKEQTP